LRVDRGTLTFTGPLDDPAVNVQVSREAVYENRRYTVGLRLSGTASNLKTEPFSRPAMSEQDILAFLLLDRPASGSGEDTGVSGALLAMGLGQMMPGDSGKFGLDEISFEGSELNQTAVVAGKRISDDIYIRYVFGLFGQPGQFRIRYRLGRGFSLEATTGGTSQALDLIYLIERE
jgi:translocation and assembly module TamB